MALLSTVGAGHAVAGARHPRSRPSGPAPMLLVDVDTGREIFGQHEQSCCRPASLTKLLTALIAEDWLPPRTLVRVSSRRRRGGPDKVGMKAGQRWPFEHHPPRPAHLFGQRRRLRPGRAGSGSVPRFATMMTAAAAQLGMLGPPRAARSRWPGRTEGAGGGNLMSAWDLAIAAAGPDGQPRPGGDRAPAQPTGSPDRTGSCTSWPTITGPSSTAIRGRSVSRPATPSPPACASPRRPYGTARVMLAIVMNGVSPDQTAAICSTRGSPRRPAAESAMRRTLPAVRRARATRPSRRPLPVRPRCAAHAPPPTRVVRASRPWPRPTTVPAPPHRRRCLAATAGRGRSGGGRRRSSWA